MSTTLLRYLGVRLALIIPTAWILMTLVFVLMRGIGDPITAQAGGRLTPAEIAKRKAEAGFDRPIWVQYWEYLTGLLRGDLGQTLTDKRSIADIIVVNGAATLELAVGAIVVALLVGIPLGRLAAKHRDRIADVFLRLAAVFFYAAPVFFVAILLKLFFSVKLGWLPASGRSTVGTEIALDAMPHRTHLLLVDTVLYGNGAYFVDALKHLVLPVLALGLLTAGVFLRLVRVNLLQTLRAGYVDAARARGLPERVVVGRHAFRNSLVPVVTVMGMQIAMLLAGAVLTETAFEWNGLGSQLAHYLSARDFIAVQGIVTVIAIIVAVMSFVIDLVVAFIDPRVRF
ncbi:ABC transporter permease [Mycobacteroides abscessus subsp. bolletii]|uniref:ABC transporter permease n=1 Tax=Mycobacteroides abscessus TaxID=36809 RepID=UPI0019D0C378|nr:ABC transporter permease [Mycobacteroides abscessus]MBN7300547.1 ABC transporter permease [Mycobacteroides abscessus subsp. bolletii]